MWGWDGNDYMLGGAGNDTLTGAGGNDTLDGGVGLDSIYGLEGKDVLDGGWDDDYIYGGVDDDTLSGGFGADQLFGESGNDTLDGNEGNDYILDAEGYNVMRGGAGNDSIKGRGRFEGGSGDDQLNASYYDDTFVFGVGDGRDTIFELGGSGDTLIFGAGINASQVYFIRDPNDANSAFFQVGGGGHEGVLVNNWFSGVNSRIEAVHFADGTVWSGGALTPAELSLVNGTASVDTLVGSGSIDIINGFTGNDTLYGNGGSDNLDGGADADAMYGGDGDDNYVVDNTADTALENAAHGTDTVNSSVTWTLGDNVEHLNLGGETAINGTGNALNNRIVGSAGANTLSGLAGDDFLAGAVGNDVLIGGLGADIYLFARGDQSDVVIENDSTAGIIDELRFGAFISADQLWFASEGADLVISIIGTNDKITMKDWYLGTDYHVERFRTADNRVMMDVQVDVLVNAMAELTPPPLGQTTLPADYKATLNSVIATAWGLLTLGTDGNNVLTGTTDNDVMDGGAGADTMSGGAGDDSYVVENALDLVVEMPNQGVDTVLSYCNGYTLSANLENMTLMGNGNIDGNGNALANVLVGNSGNNRLDGGLGADTLMGGGGDDVYVVDAIGDVVLEGTNAGSDTVLSSISYTLPDNIEKLTLTTEAAINGVGNELDNVIAGNNAANTLTGGAGNDVYVFGRGGGSDTIIDSAGAQDKLQLGPSVSLGQLWLKWTLEDSAVNHVTIGLGSGSISATYAEVVDQVTINGALAASTKVEQLNMSDGTIVNLQTMINAMVSFAPGSAATGVNLATSGAYNALLASGAVTLP
jgi:Ca2+-binding RTX toxin-like protein